jgi:hypothetical protein
MTRTSPPVERMLPLYEAKMIHHYDHRWATYEPDGSTRDVTLAEKQNPDFVALPRYWVREEVVGDRLDGKWDQDWLLGWRDNCRSTDERTIIASRFPTAAVGHTMPLAMATSDVVQLQMVWSTFVLDFVARQKVGGTHMSYGTLEQLTTPLPSLAPPWSTGDTQWFVNRGEWLQSSVSWSSNQRAHVRAEVDALMFHLYGIPRDDVDYIMETFPIVKRKDIAAHGEYLTKRLVMDIYDKLALAIGTGTPYRSPFERGDTKGLAASSGGLHGEV